MKLYLHILLVVLIMAMLGACSSKPVNQMHSCNPNGECPGTYVQMNGGW
jgi:hypothetical protein